jgi:hypothetical protein
MVTLQLLECRRPGASHNVFPTALKTYISIQNVIFPKHMLKRVLLAYESIMNVAPGVGLGGLCNRRGSHARNVIFTTLNHFANKQTTIYTNISSFLFSNVLAVAAVCNMLETSWNVMAHAQKPDFVFKAKRTSPI